MPALALVLFTAAVIGGFVWAISRPRIAVRLSGGSAVLERGELPGGLLSELNDVARLQPSIDGTLQVRGRGDTLKVTIVGLDDGPAQRVRNVVLLRRDRL